MTSRPSFDSGAMAAIQRNMELVRGRGIRLALGFIGLIVVLIGIEMALAGFLELGLTHLLYPWLLIAPDGRSRQTVGECRRFGWPSGKLVVLC